MNVFTFSRSEIFTKKKYVHSAEFFLFYVFMKKKFSFSKEKYWLYCNLNIDSGVKTKTFGNDFGKFQ